jgi:hypothetical protein
VLLARQASAAANEGQFALSGKREGDIYGGFQIMFDVITLICALGQAPQDCVPQTARVVEKIAEVDNELGCLRWGVLSTPRGAHIGPGEYPKVMCERR